MKRVQSSRVESSRVRRESPFEGPVCAARDGPEGRALTRSKLVRFSIVRWLLHVCLRYVAEREWARRNMGHFEMALPRRQRAAGGSMSAYRVVLQRAFAIVMERDPQWTRTASTPAQMVVELNSISQRLLQAQIAHSEGLIVDFLYGPVFTEEAFRRLASPELRRHSSLLHIFGLCLYAPPSRGQREHLPYMEKLRADIFLDYTGGETPAAPEPNANGTSPMSAEDETARAATRWSFPPGTTVRYRASTAGCLRQPSAPWEAQYRSGGVPNIGQFLQKWAVFAWRVLLWVKNYLQGIEDEERRGRATRHGQPGQWLQCQKGPHHFTYRFSCGRAFCVEKFSGYTRFFCTACLGWYCERHKMGRDHNCTPLRSPWAQ